MQLIVGENSYMTLEEANTLIASMYLSTSKEREFWDALNDENKSVLISNATYVVDNPEFLYKGIKAQTDQTMQWPRVINYKTVEAPDSIKRGLLLQMFSDFNTANSDEGKLIELGVKSFTDGGGAKIEFASASDSISSSLKNKNGINKKIWRTYFSEWSRIVG